MVPHWMDSAVLKCPQKPSKYNWTRIYKTVIFRHCLLRVKLRHSDVIIAKKQMYKVSDSKFFLVKQESVERWCSIDWQRYDMYSCCVIEQIKALKQVGHPLRSSKPSYGLANNLLELV